jgi:hypothetical protein
MKKLFTILVVIGLTTASFGFEYENTPQNLKELFETIMQANTKGDYATAAKLTKELFPTKECIKKAVKSDISLDMFDSYLKMVDRTKQVLSEDKKLASLLTKKAKRSEVHVYGATTEELLNYKRGSIVYKEFPGGAKKVAKILLKPNTKVYEVERVKPGSSSGYRYHLFFWNGKKWCMLGTLWRAIKK